VFFLKNIIPYRDEATGDYLNIISSEVDNAEKIVSDLLDYAHPKSEAKVEISLSDLVNHVLEQYPTPEGVAVHLNLPTHLPEVSVSPSQIFKALFNIILNACQAMPGGGTISISSSTQEEKMILLSIRDTGCGISNHNLKKIFDPLFTTKARGIGLGLSVSKSFVETNGGTIQVESDEGKGTVITVTLPIKENNP
jgi:signal transduction histidine kinase